MDISRPTFPDARRDIDLLKKELEVSNASALMHAMRASALGIDARAHRARFLGIRASTAWRLTEPLRLAVAVLVKGPAERAAAVARLRALAIHGVDRLTRAARASNGSSRPNARHAAQAASAYARPIATPAATLMTPRVLIIAELSLAQCAKYRVWQKRELFDLLGTDCTVIGWRDTAACLSALQTHPLAIFYRVPAEPSGLVLLDEARRLGVQTVWEVDDLIFDAALYAANRNLDSIAPGWKAHLLAGAADLRRAMLACDRTIASTAGLAASMAAAGAGPSWIVENALDHETITTADAIRARRRPANRDQPPRIAYGSGTKTHDVDFALAAPALAAVLAARPTVRLRIVGDLNVPDLLAPFSDRIERLPMMAYTAYLAALAEADISLAPLEATAFNDAKSNIKFIEASILGLPSICSPRAAFRSAILDGQTGLLADDDVTWTDCLLRLVDDPALRHRLGEAARAAVLARYAPVAIARKQLAPVIAGLDQRRPTLRVLVVNVFFAPVSFGGATIVAEEMVARLHRRPGVDVAVVTLRDDNSPQYTVLRYETSGVSVFSIGAPAADVIIEFDNPEMERVFADILRATQPDVVHFHSIQNLSVSLPRACQRADIPYVVTLHDAWWLCARQFMVRDDGRYCFQTKINLAVCEACLPGSHHLAARALLLSDALSRAALILAPSEAHRQLHLANAVPSERLRLNVNGIRPPARARKPRVPGTKLRLAFVGGNSRVKGVHVVRAAIELLADSNFSLTIIDNTLDFGFRSVDVAAWRSLGPVEVRPPFEQGGLDDFFDSVDVLLFPSQWKESFGLIVCEALARDVWVIASRGGGAADCIVDGRNGTLIPLTDDPDPLRRAIEALLADPTRLDGYVNPYKSSIRDYDEQADELLVLLQGVAADHASRRLERPDAAD